MGTDKGHAPTAKQLRKGPVVVLDGGVRWANSAWSPHGLAYTIKFNGHGKARILKAHFDRWINESVAAYAGIHVEKKKPPTKKKEAANA